MSQTPMKSLQNSLSQQDLRTLSALKLPMSPENNPTKIQDFLSKRQNNYHQTSYGQFFQNPQTSPLFKKTESFQNIPSHHQFLLHPTKQKYQYQQTLKQGNFSRPATVQQSLAQGSAMKSVRALSRNVSQREIGENEQQVQDQQQQSIQEVHQHRHTIANSDTKNNLESTVGFQKYVNTPIEKYFGDNIGICTCCAESIKGQQDKNLSYKYPRCVNTLYKKDFKNSPEQLQKGHGKQKQFVIDNEKRNVKIRFNPPQEGQSIFKSDFRPYVVQPIPKNEDNGFQGNPLFINSTTNSTTYANWGAKPFERVREIRKMPFDSKFHGKSTYYLDFNKPEGKQLPPDFEREYDDKFYEDMKKRNQRGEFAGLLHAPFLAKSTSQEAFKNAYQLPKSKPHPPMEELVSTLNVPHVTQTEFKSQFVEKNKYSCPRHY